MVQVAKNFGEYSIGSLNDNTGWIPMSMLVGDVAFNITGTWVGTISLYVSNQDDYIKSRFSTVTTYTANTPPLNLPRQLGRFVQFIFTLYTSGTAYIGFGKGLNATGQLIDLFPQTNTLNPTGAFS